MPTRLPSQNGYRSSEVSSTDNTSSTSIEPQPAPFTLCFGPRIDCPHDSSRPEPPRGLLMITTNPPADCTCASSKKVSPYCVCGPPCTSRSTGYFCAGSKSLG